jgi:hypothetical protein
MLTKEVQNNMKVLFWLAAVLVSPCVFAHDDEPNLKLNEAVSFQVSASLQQTSETGMSLAMIEAPFIDALQRLGKKIDQNNYSNVIGSEIQITSATIKGNTVYAVSVSSHYTEPCVSTRLGFQLTCALWERYKPLTVVDSPDAATRYVEKAITHAADAFAAEFQRR